MHEELRKIAKELRERAPEAEKETTRKCAQVVNARIGLEILAQKLKGDRDE